MTRYKAIPLPFYHKADNWEEFHMHGRGMLESYTEIEPIFNRYGFYLDRQKDFCWIETKHGCWRLDSTDEFHRHLDYISNEERILHKDVVKAMGVIRAHGLNIKELNELLYAHGHAVMLRETYRSAMKWRLAVEKEVHHD